MKHNNKIEPSSYQVAVTIGFKLLNRANLHIQKKKLCAQKSPFFTQKYFVSLMLLMFCLFIDVVAAVSFIYFTWHFSEILNGRKNSMDEYG